MASHDADSGDGSPAASPRRPATSGVRQRSGSSESDDTSGGSSAVSSRGEGVVALANTLLRCIGYDKPIQSLRELQDTASSLCVASFEAQFGVRLAAVRRFPKTTEDYEHNTRCMLNALRRLLPGVPLPHEVTVEQLCGGDVAAIQGMIMLFLELDAFLSTPGAAGYFTTPAAEAGSDGDDGAAAPGGGDATRGGSSSTRPRAAGTAASGESLPGGAGPGAAGGAPPGFPGEHGSRGSVVSSISRHSEGSAQQTQRPRATASRRARPRSAKPKRKPTRSGRQPARGGRRSPRLRRAAEGRRRRRVAKRRSPRGEPRGEDGPDGVGSGSDGRGSPLEAWGAPDGAADESSGMKEAAKASPPPRRVFRSVSSVNLALKRQVAEAQRLEKQQVAAQLRNQVKSMNEIWSLQLQHRRAVRDRVASLRKYEHNILRRAMLQRRALKHAYKVDKIKANKMADELDRETKSLRARRSSLQTALSARLVKATLEAERQASADRKSITIADTEAVLRAALAVAVSNRERVNVEKRLAKEHALEQQLEREMAAKAQRYAFRQAARDLANAHVAELGRLRDIARHREDRFIAEVVEPLDMNAVRGFIPVDPVALVEQSATSAGLTKARRIGRRRGAQ